MMMVGHGNDSSVRSSKSTNTGSMIDHSGARMNEDGEAEDADAFELFSDISKKEATLQATLQTSGKLLQPSLLDFLR